MRPFPPTKVCLFAWLLFPLWAFAQQTPPTQRNLVNNGDFERFTDEENLWDGVDSAGLLAGDVVGEDATLKRAAPSNGLFCARQRNRILQIDAILDGGRLGRLPLPVSVQVADLNKDGLLDIITVDAAGYFRVYFNSGTPTAPKFTHCEIVPLFLGRFRWPDSKGWARRHYGDGLKLALGDFDRNGAQDLVLGNYYGNVMLIKNTGSPQAPEWRQPAAIDAIKLPTTKDGHLWANLLAPAVFDWNKHNKLDLILGEGSYSANAVHLLTNVTGVKAPGSSGFVGTAAFTSSSSSAMPVFNEDNNEYLAFGDGREQLTPAVVDYNGDGLPDLLVGDRMGEVNVYLSEGPWKKGAGMELKRQPKPVSFGGVTTIGRGPAALRCVAPAVADLNGDGKFDIIVGKPDGHIAVSYNIGTPTEPKFGPLVDLKGEKVFPKDSMRGPSDWSIIFGFLQGNFMGYYTVVSPQEDQEAAGACGKHVLRAGYCPSLNRIVKRAPFLLPAEEPRALKAAVSFQPNGTDPRFWGDAFWYDGIFADSNTLILRQEQGWNVIKPNVKYNLSFRVKGRNVRNGHFCMAMGGWLVRDLAAAKTQPGNANNDLRTCEAVQTDFDFNVSSSWTVVSYQVSFQFTHPDLNSFEKWNITGSKIQYNSIFDLRASFISEDAVLYIDDVKLTPL